MLVLQEYLKGELKKTLLKSYTKKIDNTIKKGVSPCGRPGEIIMMTPDCFKLQTNDYVFKIPPIR